MSSRLNYQTWQWSCEFTLKITLPRWAKKSGSDIWIYVSQQNKYRKIERGKIASDRESMLWLDAAFALTEPSDGSKMIASFYFKVFDILW